uniref:Charged multivesicular body protein 2b n=2 Tax=Xenopus tropicalis TaxID=8364 RepID=A0A5S6L3U2_XENTR
MHIISTDQKQVFAAVQEWNQNETYNLYISDTRGVFFTLALENVKSSRGVEGNIVIDLYEVAGVKGLFLANKKVDEQIKTFITYNKGRDWRLLQAPDTDLRGNPITCLLPFCSLHFHLQMSENPYNSGSISSKVTVPWLIVASGNVGSELSPTNTNMFISSDGGNTWKHIFEEEYNIWYLDWGGALVAMKHTTLPVRHLCFDEGRSWNKYAFTSVPLFVDGALIEPGLENHIMTVFGHFSLRSEWQLVKVDYKSIFGRRCNENDFESWHLNNQRDFCVMGERKTYRKRRPGSQCLLGKDYLRTITEPCLCSHWDFECDYGYERHGKNQCSPAFWFNPTSVSGDCGQGQSYLRSSGNLTPPPYSVATDGNLWAQQGQNVTFLVHLEEGDLQRINIQLDFGDGSAVSYSNFSKIEDGIRHVYKNTGIYQVTAYAENSIGIDSSILYLHVTSPLEYVHLRVPFVAIRNKEANASAVVWPSHSGTLIHVWWIGNSTKPLITLENSISFMFNSEGINTITVQVSSGGTLIQDTKEIAVHETVLPLLSFSPNLDYHNPDIPEWRQDISRLITRALIQVTNIPEEHILVAMFPGLPTSAEVFVLPPKNASERRKGSKVLPPNPVFAALETKVIQVLEMPQLRISIFFKCRKIPWINIYAQVQHDKEQEMIGSVSQNDTAPKISLGNFPDSEELSDKELDTRVIGNVSFIVSIE